LFGQSLRHSLLCWLYHTLGQTICTVSSLEAEQAKPVISLFREQNTDTNKVIMSAYAYIFCQLMIGENR
jgi:hypothetical protein